MPKSRKQLKKNDNRFVAPELEFDPETHTSTHTLPPVHSSKMKMSSHEEEIEEMRTKLRKSRKKSLKKEHKSKSKVKTKTKIRQLDRIEHQENSTLNMADPFRQNEGIGILKQMEADQVPMEAQRDELEDV
jgi:GTPase SAR1 family protein